MRFVLLLMAVFTGVLGQIGGALAANVSATFGDWVATCEGEYYCAARVNTGTSADGLVPDTVLRIGRHSFGTYWEIAFQPFGSGLLAEKGLIVSLNDADLSFSTPTEFGSFGPVTDFFLLGEKAQKVLDLTLPAHDIAFGFSGQDGVARREQFSLDGLTAALLWIDERQGRLGSERVASAAPEGIERVIEGPIEAYPDAIAAFHAKNADCDAPEDLVHAEDGVAARLDAQRVLYLVPCWAGAYNFGFVAYVQDQYEVRQQFFASYGDRLGWTGTPFIVSAYFDPLRLTLHDFYKGRGIADCGTSASWQWQDWGFKLLEYYAKDDCDGLGEPGEFPLIYRAPDLIQGRAVERTE